jgi:hypothetical protein
MRWRHVDLPGTMQVRRNWVNGKEKYTKTHQMRRLALDPATVEVLTEHYERYKAFAKMSARNQAQTRTCSPMGPSMTDRPVRAASRTGTAGCAPSSASTATCSQVSSEEWTRLQPRST